MDLESLLARSLPQQDVKLGDGTVVRVRGLSRAEVLRFKDLTGDQGALEAACLSAGMLDPHLPPERVGELLAVLTNDDVDRLLEAIRDLSGLREGQAKADYKSPPG